MDRLIEWCDQDQGARRFWVRYNKPRMVGATTWTGGWLVRLFTTRKTKRRRVWHSGSTMEIAAGRALAAESGKVGGK